MDVPIRFGSSPFQYALFGTNNCGAGFSDGKFLAPGEEPSHNLDPTNILDGFCGTHDLRTYQAEKSSNPYQNQLAADEQLRADIANAAATGQFKTPEEIVQAAVVLGAFLFKDPLYTRPLAFQESVKSLLNDMLSGLTQGRELGRMLNSQEWATGSWNDLASLPSLNDPNWSPGQHFVDNRVATTFNNFSLYPQRTDPFTLDLDGDGIETVGINAAKPVLFDIDAVGIKKSVGWVKADDGLLALDRNGNNTIDRSVNDAMFEMRRAG